MAAFKALLSQSAFSLESKKNSLGALPTKNPVGELRQSPDPPDPLVLAFLPIMFAPRIKSFNVLLKIDIKLSKAFGKGIRNVFRQRIPESSDVRKETVDIFVTSRDGDRKILQSFRITSRPPL